MTKTPKDINKYSENDELGREELLTTLLFWKDMLNKVGDVWAKHDEQAYNQIVALIQKPQVTEEWFEEKAKVIYDHCKKWDLIDCKDFIRSLVEEIQRVA